MMQTGLDGVLFASNVLVKDPETLNMILDDDLTDGIEDVDDEYCDDEDYADAMEELEEEHSWIETL